MYTVAWAFLFIYLKIKMNYVVVRNIAASISIMSVLSILTNVFIILYLGPTFGRTDTIDSQDWKRKWILFFSWLNIAIFGLITTFTLGGILFVPFVGTAILLILLTAVFTILYLGPTFGDPGEIDVDDWKRKWILFFAWFGVVLSGISLIGSLSTSFWGHLLDNWSARQIVIGPGRHQYSGDSGQSGVPAVVVNGSNAQIYRGWDTVERNENIIRLRPKRRRR